MTDQTRRQLAINNLTESVVVPTPPPASTLSVPPRTSSGVGKGPSQEDGNRSNSVSTLKSEVSEGEISATSTSAVVQDRKPLDNTINEVCVPKKAPVKHHHGIYWRSPISMVAFLFLGVMSGVAHHLYYSSLAGKQVGGDGEQQWNLRSGFSFN